MDKHYKFQQAAARVNGHFRGVPFYGIGNGNAYRKDVFEKLGISPPDTWDDYLKIGKKLKDNDWPVGQTLSHTFGDAPTFAYPLLWSFGGQEVDEKGKVAINSQGTRDACDFLREFWKAACDEGGLAWDDSSNNRAFYGETIGASLNGASIYFNARYRNQGPPGLADKNRSLPELERAGRPLPRDSALHPLHHAALQTEKRRAGFHPLRNGEEELRAVHPGAKGLWPRRHSGMGKSSFLEGRPGRGALSAQRQVWAKLRICRSL